jgi:hypothetical protein
MSTTTRLPYTTTDLATMGRGMLLSLCQGTVQLPLGASTATMRRLLAPLCRAESPESPAVQSAQPTLESPAPVQEQEQVTVAQCSPVETPRTKPVAVPVPLVARRLPRAELDALVAQHRLKAPMGASRGQLAVLLGKLLPEAAPKARAVREPRAVPVQELPRTTLEAMCRERGVYVPLGASRKTLLALLKPQTTATVDLAATVG